MVLCVLMSAYNGKKYIMEQLESIFAQQADCEITVCVRDDGSKDGTPDFLRQEAERRGWRLDVIEGENAGPSGSFLRLIEQCPDADIYAFSDQDDVWLEGKVARAMEALKGDEPTLWTSNLDVVDSELKLMKHAPIAAPESDPMKILFYNNMPGCTMMFNRALLTELRRVGMKDFRMHDILALDLATLIGRVVFEPAPCIQYRQHQNNAIGYNHKKIRPVKWIRDKFRQLFDKREWHNAQYAERVLALYSDRLPAGIVKEMRLLADYKKSVFKTIALLRRPYTHNGFNRTAISIRCKIALRKF